MKNFGLLLAASFLLFGCTDKRDSARRDLQPKDTMHNQETAPSHLPGFDVDVVLVGEARTKIAQLHESIIVFGYVSGMPKPGVKDEDLDEMGAVTICNLKSEMEHAGTFQFSGFDIPEEKLEQVEGSDYELSIDVASGRKSSQDNLLDCGIYQGSFKAVQNRTIDIDCKLIGENINIPREGKVR